MSSKFIKHIKDMSATARGTILVKGMPQDLRDPIMDLTPFTKKNAGTIIVPVVTLIKTLSTPFIIRAGPLSGTELKNYPSWLLEISQGFIDLLKYYPHLPPILDLFKELIQQQQQNLHDQIIEQFIRKNRLHQEMATDIKSYFHGVISKRDGFLLMNGVQNDRYAPMFVDMEIKYIFPILEELYTLNQIEYYHKMMKLIYLDDEMQQFKKNPRIYDEINTFDFENLLLDEIQQQEQRQGGNRKKKMRSSTRIKCKRIYKKRSCKNVKKCKKM